MAKTELKRHKDVEWGLPYLSESRIAAVDSHRVNDNYVLMALLMDVRDELKALNKILNCPNFLNMPRTIRTISRNTAKPRKKTTDV